MDPSEVAPSSGDVETPNIASSAESHSDAKISLGSIVILRKLAKGRRYCYKQVTVQQDGRTAFKGSPQIALADLIGHRFGTLFRIAANNGSLEAVANAAEFDQFEDQLVSDLNSQAQGDLVSERDNRNITDSAQNQTLTPEDLDQLKQSGESGRAVISRLIDSSANFDQKTSFSQEKYVRKKKEKYLDYVAALEPSSRNLSEIRGRGLNLRFDMLSQLLAYANVHCATRVLLVDESHNLLLSQAVCERLDASSGGRLCLLTTHGGCADIDRLKQRCRQTCSVGIQCQAMNTVRDALDQIRARESGSAVKRQHLEHPDLLVDSEWDCLIVASRLSPVSLMPLLKLLLPGKAFAFHSAHQDALVKLGEAINSRGLANTGPLLLFDSFCRPWQMLQGRCRPAMRMEAMGSGFALVGRKSGDEGESEDGDGGDSRGDAADAADAAASLDAE